VTDVPPPPPPAGPPPEPPGGQPPAEAASPDVGAALSYGFNKYFANIGPVLAVVLIPIAVQLALGFLGQFVFRALIAVLLLNIVSWIVSAVAQLGIFQMSLMITAGEAPDIGKAFTYDRWGEWFVFSIVWGLIVGVGLALCIIPGLLALAFLGFSPLFFIEKRMGIGDAFNAALEAARRGYALPTILAIIVGVLGVILCGIGVFITAPAAYLAVAFLYRGANRQPVAS
jgi:hypothetical protein